MVSEVPLCQSQISKERLKFGKGGTLLESMEKYEARISCLKFKELAQNAVYVKV